MAFFRSLQNETRNRGKLPDLIPGAVFVDTQSATLTSLQMDRAKSEPAFAAAIIRAYAKAKLQKGHTVEEVDEKLEALRKEIARNEMGDHDDAIEHAHEFIRQPSAAVPSHSAPYVNQEEIEKNKFGFWGTNWRDKGKDEGGKEWRA